MAVPGAQLIVKPWLLLWTGGCGAGRADTDRLSALVGWHCGAATQRAGVDHRALCVHWAATIPASECTFHRNYVCPSVPTQNGRDGLVGGGRRTYPDNNTDAFTMLSALASDSFEVPIKDVNERSTSMEIVSCHLACAVM